MKILAIVFLFALFVVNIFVAQGCHNPFNHKRRKRSVQDEFKLINFFTECIQRKTNVGTETSNLYVAFTILQDKWYQDTNNIYCKGPMDTVSCWQSRIYSLLYYYSQFNWPARQCIHEHGLLHHHSKREVRTPMINNGPDRCTRGISPFTLPLKKLERCPASPATYTKCLKAKPTTYCTLGGSPKTYDIERLDEFLKGNRISSRSTSGSATPCLAIKLQDVLHEKATLRTPVDKCNRESLGETSVFGNCPSNYNWSPWMNRDKPTGSGDYERFSYYNKIHGRTHPCNSVSAVQAETVTGTSYKSTDDNVEVDLTGLVCRNKGLNLCNDYKVRFCCPPPSVTMPGGFPGHTAPKPMPSNQASPEQTPTEPKPMPPDPLTPVKIFRPIPPTKPTDTYGICPSNYKWTHWMNRDKPSGSGDFELISYYNNIYGRTHPCSKVSAVQAQTVTGRSYKSTGDRVSVNFSGLICRNSSSNPCNDYMVRFCCPPPRSRSG